MEKGGLICISGCPRSGTSLTMEIQRVVHGDAMILGEQFPQENRKKMRLEMLESLKEENPRMYQVQKYLLDRQQREVESKMSETERDFRDMNPDGFWEMAFTVQGVIYRPQLRHIFDDLKSGSTKFCKVVSQGLLNSDPSYLSKIIYSIRHPRAVAKSQERLVRGFSYTDPVTGKVKNAFEDMVIHTPEMFIQVTAQAARFFIMHPEVPVHFIHFEEMLENPKPVIDGIGEFVGFGDYSKAYDVVKPKLNRSKHEDVASNLWEDAEFVYAEFCEGAKLINAGDGDGGRDHFKAILEYLSDPQREINKEKMNWPCPRAKRTATYSLCKQCQTSESLRENMKKHSESIRGEFTDHWSKEPCLFECGFDPEREGYLTLEESIEHNFWKTNDLVTT